MPTTEKSYLQVVLNEIGKKQQPSFVLAVHFSALFYFGSGKEWIV